MPLPNLNDTSDPMHIAEQVEAGGALAFLATPIPEKTPVPGRLIAKALSLYPQTRQGKNLWTQISTAVLTLGIFGLGSYALANNLSSEPISADLFLSDEVSLFETANESGFFSFDA